MRTVLVGDLGGTKCRFALVAADLSVHCVVEVETIREREPFLAEFDRAVTQVLREVPAGLEAPCGAGFGTPGVIVPDERTVDYAPNVPLDRYPLADHVEGRFGLPTALINDGRASAWGEFLRGHAAGMDPLLCLFFGTGIGIGLMVNGSPYSGIANAAGEIGHSWYRPGQRRCPCGADGHFEAYCGGRAIVERAAEECGPIDGRRLRVDDVVAFAGHEDERGLAARQILEDAAEAACVMVTNACILLNPAAVVLGGGVLAGWPALRGRIADHLAGNTSRLIHDRVVVVSSLGGSDAVLWGAAVASGRLRD